MPFFVLRCDNEVKIVVSRRKVEVLVRLFPHTEVMTFNKNQEFRAYQRKHQLTLLAKNQNFTVRKDLVPCSQESLSEQEDSLIPSKRSASASTEEETPVKLVKKTPPISVTFRKRNIKTLEGATLSLFAEPKRYRTVHTLAFDGSARFYDSSCAWVLFDLKKRIILEGYQALGKQDSMYAEFRGFMRGLEEVKRLPIENLQVLTDCKSLTQLVKYPHRCNNDALSRLAREVRRNLECFRVWDIFFIHREFNSYSDGLTKLAYNN